jgi:Mrp family chromosome partitioning ATPase
VLPVADALVVSAVVDATFLVVSAGSSRDKEIRRALELLHQVGAPVRGTVLNNAPSAGPYGYGYEYGYRRGRSEGPRRLLARR